MNGRGAKTPHNTPVIWFHRFGLWLLFAVLIILLGAALRFYQLGRDSLWLDEIVTQQITQHNVRQMLNLVGHYDDHPPLFYLIEYQNRLMGFSDFAARLPSAIAGILTIPVVIVLARRLWGAPIGLMAGLLLALWPTHLHFSQEARQYALLMLFISIATYRLYRGVSDGGIAAWIGYILSSVGALYSHNSAFLWTAGQIIFVVVMGLLSWREESVAGMKRYVRRVVPPFFLALFLIALFYLPWAPHLLIQSKRLIRGVSLPAGAAGGFAYYDMLKRSLRFFAEKNVLFEGVFIALTLVGFIVGALQRRWAALILVVSSSIAPFLLAGIISSSHFFSGRYLFPILLPIILLSAEAFRPAFSLVASSLNRSLRAQAFGMIGIFFVVTALALFPIRGYYHRGKEGWHDAARYLAREMGPDDLILVDGMLLGKVGDAGRVQQALGYYLPDKELLPVEPDTAQTLLDHPRPGATVWGVLWYQGRLKSRKGLLSDIDFRDYPSLVVLSLKHPSGDLRRDAVEILEAMLQIQPYPESKPDMQALLAELNRALGREAP
jgi:4-amino-4-deoxy-L-arabinose transferase-like glycosyltransferase